MRRCLLTKKHRLSYIKSSQFELLLLVNVYLNNQFVTALLDTGSACTLVHADYAQRQEPIAPLLVNGLTGNNYLDYASTVKVQFENHPFTHSPKAYAHQQMNHPILLGMDFLIHLMPVINFYEKFMAISKLPQFQIPFHFTKTDASHAVLNTLKLSSSKLEFSVDNPSNRFVFADDLIELKPMTYANVKVRIPY